MQTSVLPVEDGTGLRTAWSHRAERPGEAVRAFEAAGKTEHPVEVTPD